MPREYLLAQNDKVKIVFVEEGTLGDRVEAALRIAGVTSERVEDWLGFPCGCEERKEKLNQLESWAKRVLRGKTDKAKEYLRRLMSPTEESS